MIEISRIYAIDSFQWCHFIPSYHHLEALQIQLETHNEKVHDANGDHTNKPSLTVYIFFTSTLYRYPNALIKSHALYA